MMDRLPLTQAHRPLRETMFDHADEKNILNKNALPCFKLLKIKITKKSGLGKNFRATLG